MSFTSLSFPLFVFAVVLVYFLSPARFRWIILLAASLLFYWLNSGRLLLILVGTALVTFLVGLSLDRANVRDQERLDKLKQLGISTAKRNKVRAEMKLKNKRILIAGIIVDLGALLFLKYFNFFAGNANILLRNVGITLPSLGLLLPLGISFYTLQAISYLVDIFRGKLHADTSFLKFLLFMSFFPQIIQGPIPRHNQLANQLYTPHQFDYTRMCHGLQLMLWGWFQKLVIADRIAIPVNQVFDNSDSYQGLIIFFAAAGYGLQVYADFSGGMDVARGVSQILGIELELNFKRPYFSTSIEDFWRRWHISLGAWMKNYVFYPLSLSKSFTSLSKKSRKVLGDFVGKRLAPIMAMFIVYFLVGFWHGPQWKYVAYGVWNGTFITAGILLPEAYGTIAKALRFNRDSAGFHVFQVIRTFSICSLGRLFSRGNGFLAAMRMFAALGRGWWDLSFLLDGTLVELGLETANWLLLAMAIVVLFWVDYQHEGGVHLREMLDQQHIVFRWLVFIAAILAIVIFGMWGPSYNAADFIYGQY